MRVRRRRSATVAERLRESAVPTNVGERNDWRISTEGASKLSGSAAASSRRTDLQLRPNESQTLEMNDGKLERGLSFEDQQAKSSRHIRANLLSILARPSSRILHPRALLRIQISVYSCLASRGGATSWRDARGMRPEGEEGRLRVDDTGLSPRSAPPTPCPSSP